MHGTRQQRLLQGFCRFGKPKPLAPPPTAVTSSHRAADQNQCDHDPTQRPVCASYFEGPSSLVQLLIRQEALCGDVPELPLPGPQFQHTDLFHVRALLLLCKGGGPRHWHRQRLPKRLAVPTCGSEWRRISTRHLACADCRQWFVLDGVRLITCTIQVCTGQRSADFCTRSALDGRSFHIFSHLFEKDRVIRVLPTVCSVIKDTDVGASWWVWRGRELPRRWNSGFHTSSHHSRGIGCGYYIYIIYNTINILSWSRERRKHM